MKAGKKRKEVRPPNGYSLFYKQAKKLFPSTHDRLITSAMRRSPLIQFYLSGRSITKGISTMHEYWSQLRAFV